MENASKALIMAGEILIALLILALVVYGYSNIRNLSASELTEKEIEQLAVFNKEYESYNRKLLRGVDVISVINKAIDNNKKYENDNYYTINIQFKMAEEVVYKKDGKTSTTAFNINKYYNMNDFEIIKNDTDAFTDFKRRIFDCTELKYNETSGRVNYMKFEERKMTENGYINGIN